MITYIVVRFLSAFVVALIGGLALRIGCDIVAEFKPKFATAYVAALLGQFFAILLSVIVFVAAQMEIFQDSTALLSIRVFLVLIVQSGINYSLIKHPERGRLGIHEILGVTVVQMIVTFVIRYFIAFIIATTISVIA